MVKLTKIYTRGGDAGETSLGDGTRVAKHDVRVAAYGAVDEANACVGIARLHTEADADAMLARIQNDLFDLGADLCRPIAGKSDGETEALRITSVQIVRLETEIDILNETLGELTSFVLPGGTSTGAHLHLARAVVRRAERLISELVASGASVNPLALTYANRLSDLLFQMSRSVNGEAGDVLWKPGDNA